jgi:thiol-disulfide isomerase/thioredoxin
MVRRSTLWVALAAVLLIAAGCSASAVPPAAGAQPTADSSQAVALPTAPAPADSYRADPAALVGATGRPQLIEFFAYWCTTCRAMRPTVHDLETSYWGKVDFVYLDIDNTANANMMQRYAFTAQPLFVLVAPDGTEIHRWFGYTQADEFTTAFDNYLAEHNG